MTGPASRSKIGRHVFGFAGVVFGLITLVWHDYTFQLLSIWNARDGPALVYVVAAIEILGGTAIQFRRTAKAGAVAVGAVYLVFALLCIPHILAAPKTYDSWGNFFEQFSLVTGAGLVFARASSAWTPDAFKRIGRVLLGLCAISFALEQALYLDNTVVLVPKWLPPSQTFWAVATTAFFGLAAAALLANRTALLAARLLALMLVIFGLAVWIPVLLSDLHNQANWGETVETFAIAGAVWILADLLGERRPDDGSP
jgi:hypothetical protein